MRFRAECWRGAAHTKQVRTRCDCINILLVLSVCLRQHGHAHECVGVCKSGTIIATTANLAASGLSGHGCRVPSHGKSRGAMSTCVRENYNSIIYFHIF